MPEPKYSAREFITFCHIYNLVGQKKMSVSVESIHRTTGLDRPLCQALLANIQKESDLNAEMKTRVLVLTPIKMIAKENRVSVKDLQSDSEKEERRLLSFAADRIIKLFKQQYPGITITYAYKQTLNSMAKKYSFDTIQKVVEYAFKSDGWSSRIKSVYDLNKLSVNAKKAYIDIIIEQMKAEESELNFIRTAQM